jgi:hypothetical protein
LHTRDCTNIILSLSISIVKNDTCSNCFICESNQNNSLIHNKGNPKIYTTIFEGYLINVQACLQPYFLKPREGLTFVSSVNGQPQLRNTFLKAKLRLRRATYLIEDNIVESGIWKHGPSSTKHDSIRQNRSQKGENEIHC